VENTRKLKTREESARVKITKVENVEVDFIGGNRRSGKRGKTAANMENQ